ncbi:MAG: SUMF1/EgtB/PvdO family nonheme iron enzyme [Planctomycetes bacterium]|nr:SUMF1/EgtB/PvdO family nonheme iron enzyme [Planctomycetota bacterium]MBL7040975.1 SUMF1/EgtB/PvdO family nonheme iron enzyme [Pirellulaceae bacterium]
MLKILRHRILTALAAVGGLAVAAYAQVHEGPRSPGARVTSKINEVAFAYRWCPPGEFKMGASDDATEEYGERFVPQHRVRISNGFWIQETEVTQSQYEMVMGTRPSFWQSRRKLHNPVERVSWFDAVEYCAKLSKLDAGYLYRLPSEAEWEYACRAGTVDPRYGDLMDIAWVFVNTDEGEGSTGHRAVGKKEPNPWGLCDMFGNVAEWCSDWYGPPQSLATSGPSGPKSEEYRVVRGDDCFADCTEHFPGCLAGARGSWRPSEARRTIGFRVVRVPITAKSDEGRTNR